MKGNFEWEVVISMENGWMSDWWWVCGNEWVYIEWITIVIEGQNKTRN
jgi:hypothetical protein